MSGVSVDPKHPTGVSLITVDKFGENTIVAAYGANSYCGNEELILAEKAVVDDDILLIQNEVPSEFNQDICALAQSQSLPIIWDPAPYKARCDKLITSVSMLTPNIGESELLTGLQITNVETVSVVCKQLAVNGASTPI